ncbi:MAG: hypothetical protein H7Z43_03560, partial [Clostridia bacterium]|nr:hypothetical protein [Deltaproteobacteria bacterium]
MNVFPLRSLQTAMLVIAFACVAVINVGSRIGVHPDEPLHIASARYFEHHELPPVVDESYTKYLDPAYGVSYALSVPPELAYFIYGRLARFYENFGASFAYGCRYAALTLFAMLTGFCAWHRPKHPAFAFMLLATPQVWYVFSYVNGDAYGIFASFWVVWQLGYRGSLGRGFIDRNESKRGAAHVAIALAALFLCKRNYLPFLMYAIAHETVRSFGDKPRFKRWVFAVGLAVVIGGGITIYDEARNDFSKTERALLLREEHAQAPWKQSAIDKGTAMQGLGLRQKGVPAMQVLFAPWHWLDGIYKTFLGVYGPMSIWFPPWQYALRGLAFLGLTVLAFWGSRKHRLEWLGGGAMVCAIILAAFEFAWTYDFQPQGRYIFAL